MFVSQSVRKRISGTTRPIFTKFLCTLPVVAARSSSGGVAIRHVLPVLWMLHILVGNGGTSIPSQRATSLCRRAQVDAAAASYWLHGVLDDGGRRD